VLSPCCPYGSEEERHRVAGEGDKRGVGFGEYFFGDVDVEFVVPDVVLP
jgi:hypothetical protein